MSCKERPMAGMVLYMLKHTNAIFVFQRNYATNSMVTFPDGSWINTDAEGDVNYNLLWAYSRDPEMLLGKVRIRNPEKFTTLSTEIALQGAPKPKLYRVVGRG